MRKNARPKTAADAAAMINIDPFFLLQRNKAVLRMDGDRVAISRRFLVDLLRPTLLMVRFDADFYRLTYPDLADAEREGVITDLQEHYVAFGYFENRLPCEVEVDGSFYAREYPDVAAAIIEGKTPSPQAHFNAAGFAEGRLPRKGWAFRDLLSD
jgi:hypothetical protein